MNDESFKKYLNYLGIKWPNPIDRSSYLLAVPKHFEIPKSMNDESFKLFIKYLIINTLKE
jgi:hypothetical protein